MVRVYTLHRRDAGTMALVVLRDTRWRGDRAIIATMEMDLSRGTQMTYVIPDLMISIDDFSNHLELSIQTHGYNDWQGGTSNLLITRMMLGRLTNTSFTNFSYNVQHVADYLASRGVIALPGNRFSTEELQNQRWVLRPTLRRNPMAPTRVQSRALMDGSVSLQFEGYTAVPEQHPYQVNENDEEIHSPEQEILAVLTIEEVLPIVEFKRLSPNSTIPTRATYGAAGYDLHIISNVEINAGGRDLLGTGLAMAIPEGYYGRIAPRSGVAWKKGIHIGAGVIDSDYRGEIKILVFNLTYEPVQFKRGEAIAQIIFTKIATPTMMQVPQLPDTRRGTSGFGSTSNETSVNQVPPEDRVSIGSSEWNNIIENLCPPEKLTEDFEIPLDEYDQRLMNWIGKEHMLAINHQEGQTMQEIFGTPWDNLVAVDLNTAGCTAIIVNLFATTVQHPMWQSTPPSPASCIASMPVAISNCHHCTFTFHLQKCCP
ncbi:uncharacterized protein LOC141834350 [Curcuma longa]|uniref:uncharacterized protein LOC141834350 n=1 Tax=Curcuma longa TaxID=136217 RepID=UPI003D9EBAF1